MADPTTHPAGETLAGPHLISAELTPDEQAAALETGRLLFAGACDFFFGAQKLDQLPPLRGRKWPSPGGPMSANPRC